ncbi:MAG: nucleotide exchange factor GrpE [Hyphomicrobiales bacterium]|nr:nucleotide exchange factor GrpE [Hyphomicrobiales bacterium]
MTDHAARHPQEVVAEPDVQATPTASPATPDQMLTEDAKIAALVETLARENAEHKDRVLRTLAEMENLRKRTERELNDMRHYGIAAFARDVLGVADTLDRALKAIDAELKEDANPGVRALLEGVELTERELLKVLEKHGVKKFEPRKGDRFDPNLHQAMFELPDPSQPTGTVAQVVQPGYMIGERMLRAALVGVAKGGPKPTPANDNPETAPDTTPTS